MSMHSKLTQEQKLVRSYNKGNAAFHDGFKEEDCPDYGGLEMSAWLMGFHDGKDNVFNDADYILEKLLN